MCRINFAFVGLVLEAVVLPRQNSSQIKAFIRDFIFIDLSHSKLKQYSNKVPTEWGWNGSFEPLTFEKSWGQTIDLKAH